MTTSPTSASLSNTYHRMRGSAPPSTSTQDEDDHRGHSVNVTELNQTAQRAIAIAASVAWMVVSSSLILVNKHLMSNDGFHYPMALSGLGMGFSAVASWLVCKVFKLVEAKKSISAHFYMTRIVPVGLFMALTLHFGNVVYLYLTVSFIQMLKAFTPIITMIALFMAALEVPTRQLISSVLLIALGTAIASYGEINLNIIGVICMFASESFEATRLVMTQVVLVGLKFNAVEGLMYLAPACFAWLLLGSLILEGSCLGLYVNALAYMVIQTGSSLTLKVLGTVKNALVVWLGILIFAEVVTPLQGAGYLMSLIGFGLYNYIKLRPKVPERTYRSIPAEDVEQPGPEKVKGLP
ncbi:hypothetical protein WJX84_008174 [Apatococcus fuscideae]|uniref:Sugar phosphate transporter domain-containing protein n=1 Tax=Apatococcus fuscideae TaxID=2026836 RepID=A0AAW1T8K6_9CHLO